MERDKRALGQALAAKVEQLWQEVSWDTPREDAEQLRQEAIQACHALHRAANPAYRERCKREQIGERLESVELPAVVFPEEIYKAYSEKRRTNGKKLGVFCEQDVPMLMEYLNHYLVHPMTMDGLAQSYMTFTSVRGGLDRLRADLLNSQGVLLVTSSGTSGSAISLIPFDQDSFRALLRMFQYAFAEITNIPGYGPIDSDQHCLVAIAPRSGAMMQAVAFGLHAKGFGERAFLTIPADVGVRELRWRGNTYAGLSGAILRLIMTPISQVASRQTSRQGFENWIAGLKRAEELEVRTAVFTNPWIAYNTLKRMESLLADDIARGAKMRGDPYVSLAPGSVLIYGGGNKSGLNVSEEEITALFRRMIGGLDRVVDVWTQSESFGSAIRCDKGNYHLDPHVEYFVIDSYLAYFDPRQTSRIPAIVTGDLVDMIYEEPCPCGAPTRYFKTVQRDDVNRGSKGCAAALAEYA